MRSPASARSRRSPHLVIVAVTGLAVLVSGCWDRQELNQRTLMLALGIDRGPKPGLLTVSAEIAVPGGIPLGTGQAGGGGRPRPPTTVMASTGHTVEEAIAHLSSRLEWPVFLGHVRVVAVSEEVARQGMGTILDVLRRNPQIRRLLWLVVTEGEARQLLDASPPTEQVPIFFVINQLDTQSRAGTFPRLDLGEFAIRAVNPGEDPAAPVLQVRKDDIQWNGLAVFRHDRMVGKLPPDETRTAFALASSGPDRAEIEMKMDKSRVRIRHFSRETRLTPVVTPEGPRMSVTVRLESNVVEVAGPMETSSPSVLQRIQRAAQEDEERRLRQVLSRLQRLGVDVLGYGEVFRARLPEVWKSMEGTSYFRTLPVDLQVDVTIRRVGMVTK